ncbi:hypothetical protein [Delftia sp. HK171]|uniref:hypothetical protein n=1 Tax=Delftia sp. HK171 TaxID=1920191 RepID=UPI00114F93EA|nr:hypothetical protein [Delftia sp. HK171]TQL87459.1 hypothetical protein FB549_0080 [Delftia sp. HK171]
MVTPEQKAAREAFSRLGSTLGPVVQMAATLCAVRALILAHPNPEAVRTSYDQLIGQLMATPGIADSPDQMVVLRDMTATLFRPPVQLDTGE